MRARLSGLATLIKTGSGLFVLAGSNTYSGLTTINAGIARGLDDRLDTRLVNSLPIRSAWPPGGLLAVGVGGPQQWTAANITVAAWRSPRSSVPAARSASTPPGAISAMARTSPAAALGLVKLGPNMLTLTGTNTYTGGTLVSSGGLEATNPSALAGAFTPGG